MIMESKL